jgi:D-amino-acid dehydrogenase
MHDLQRTGALSVYETESGYHRDAVEWAHKRSHGIIAQEVSGDEAREMEPALGPLVKRAVFTPQWSAVSDPKRIVDTARTWLSLNGAVIRRGDVRDIETGVVSPVVVRLTTGSLGTDLVLIAAGAWSRRWRNAWVIACSWRANAATT